MEAYRQVNFSFDLSIIYIYIYMYFFSFLYIYIHIAFLVDDINVLCAPELRRVLKYDKENVFLRVQLF